MNESNSWLIRNARLLDVRAHRLECRDLRIEAGRITEIGAPGMPAARDTPVLDADSMLVMPGLVNAHTHGHGTLAKGLGDRWTLELLLNAGPWLSAGRTLEHKYLSAMIGAVEMIRKGCTSVYDLYVELPSPSVEGMHAVARAYDDCGMRAVVAPMIADKTFFEAIPGLSGALPHEMQARVESLKLQPFAASLATCKTMMDRWPVARERVRPALAPTIPLHCTDEMLIECARLAREYQVGLHMHLGESKVQAVSGLTRYQCTLTCHLDDIGFLGPDFTAAHAVWLDDEDIHRLADNGSSVAHNPGSNLRLGSGVARVREMLDAGVNVGIGTDGAHCADNQNMFEALRMASFVSRIRSHDPHQWIQTEEVLEMGTSGSATALGFGTDVGRLACGYRADLILIDLAHVNWIPLNDPTNQLVHTEDAGGVDTVMIDGRLILRHGKFLSLDLADLAAKAEQAVQDLASLNEEARHLAGLMEEHIGHYCLGLSRTKYPVNAMVGGHESPAELRTR